MMNTIFKICFSKPYSLREKYFSVIADFIPFFNSHCMTFWFFQILFTVNNIFFYSQLRKLLDFII